MADGPEIRRRGVERGQGLLPHIPDHITIQNIAPKMVWETSNVMRMVSREWRQAFHNRSVYDARVLSKSTEAFLVLRSIDQMWRTVFILFSCKYGTSQKLPPISEVDGWENFECICLDGRLYVSKTMDSDHRMVKLWALDLAGDWRWTELGQVESSAGEFYYGALGGKLYRFHGYTRPDGISVLEASGIAGRQSNKPSPLEVARLPQTQVYDPQSNIWSTITPKISRDYTCYADAERHFASFFEWETEHLQNIMGLPENIRTYEPFYSEWRLRLSINLTSDNDYCHNNAMAPQVYHRLPYEKLTMFLTASQIPNYNYKLTRWNIFFIGEKLVRLVDYTLSQRGAGVDLKVFNIQKDAWEQWQSFTTPCVDGNRIGNIAFADNSIWTLVGVPNVNAKVVLVRSLPFLCGEAHGYSAGWIHTTCSFSIRAPRFTLIRPIYL